MSQCMATSFDSAIFWVVVHVQDCLCSLFVCQFVSFLFLFVLHSEVHTNNTIHCGLWHSVLPRQILLTRWVGAIDVLCDFVYEPLFTDKWRFGVLALFLAGRFFPVLFFFGIDDVIACVAANWNSFFCKILKSGIFPKHALLRHRSFSWTLLKIKARTFFCNLAERLGFQMS